MPAKPSNKKKTIPQKTISLKNNFQKKTIPVPPWAIYAVLVITALVYSQALFNGFVEWDDSGYVTKNFDIRNFSFEGIKTLFSSYYVANYQPLTMLTYFFEYRFFGLNPLPYHFTSVFLHLVNTFLVYKFVEKLSEQRFTALFAAAMFALHPLHVESVAWVAERKDVMYSLFFLAALIAYVNYLTSGLKWKHYWICLFMFILSLLSKSAAVTLPVLMIAMDLYKNRKFNAKMLVEKIPFFALALLFGIIALLSQKEARGEASTSIIDKFFYFCYTLSFYIVKLVAPFKLSAMHYYPLTHGKSLPWMFYAALPFLLLLVVWLVRKTSLRREKLFGVFFFLIVISIMLQIISVGNAIAAERYSYISYIGLFYIAGQWIVQIPKPTLKRFMLVVSALFLIMFSYLSWDRIKVWDSCFTLFDDVVKKYPDNPDGYNTRAIFKKSHDDFQGALQDCNKALSLNPLFQDCLVTRGSVLVEFRDYKNALNDLNLAIDLDSSKANAFNNRGMALQGLNDTSGAMRDFNKAISMTPDMYHAYNNRSILKAIMGNIPGAIEDVNKAISIDPEESVSYCTRANIKTLQKDYPGAIEDYNAALRLKPKDNEVMFNLGMAKLNVNDTSGACEEWHKSLSFGDKNAENMINLICNK